ncbi:cysteine-rich secretory protein 1 [Macaca nemestrina]|uniref:cysteine-rich secretory protein 1 n=1 Tax=Macaca nemestrina TaxID=9545 RepID=UPI0039B9A252
MEIKHLLFLVAAACLLPMLSMKRKSAKKLFNKLVTDLPNVQQEIVDIHNTLRRGVVPPASNMLKMSWSEEAAQNARIFSRYCDMTESNPLERRLPNTFCGENRNMTSYPVSWSSVIGVWYSESKYFKYGLWPSTDDDISTDRYTQIVWATSYLIGCAIAPCRHKGSPRYFYVCHYCHEGNDPETKHEPYKKGVPCEACPNNCEDKLCTNPCIYYDEYTDCSLEVRFLGCNHSTPRMFCKATCLCDTEIK